MLIHALLIEDNIDFAELVIFLLTQGDAAVQFDLRWETTLSGALIYLGESQVDIAIVDLGLSDSQGPETAAKIAEAAAEMPLIVLSAEESDSVVYSVIQSGAEDHIVKAECDGHTLIAAGLNAIARHFESRELRHRSVQSSPRHR